MNIKFSVHIMSWIGLYFIGLSFKKKPRTTPFSSFLEKILSLNESHSQFSVFAVPKSLILKRETPLALYPDIPNCTFFPFLALCEYKFIVLLGKETLFRHFSW